MSQHPKLAILGFGTMGQAISAGLVEASGYPADHIQAADLHPAAGKARAGALGIQLSSAVEATAQAAESADIRKRPPSAARRKNSLRKNPTMPSCR